MITPYLISIIRIRIGWLQVATSATTTKCDRYIWSLIKVKVRSSLSYNLMYEVVRTSAKWKNQSLSTKGGYDRPGPPGPPWSTLVHIFSKISKSVDHNGLEWIRWTTETTTPLGGPGAFRTILHPVPTFSWWTHNFANKKQYWTSCRVIIENLLFRRWKYSLPLTFFFSYPTTTLPTRLFSPFKLLNINIITMNINLRFLSNSIYVPTDWWSKGIIKV